MLHAMLRGPRATLAPNSDQGADDADEIDLELEDAGPDEELDDEVDGDEDGGGADHATADDAGERGGPGDDVAQDVDREVAQPTRGAARIAALNERARAAEERANEAIRRAEALQQQISGQQNERARQAELERLEMMTPEERVEYRLAQMQDQTNRQIQAVQFQAWDASDRAQFEALRQTKPALAAVTDEEINAALQQMRASGTNAPRETVATFLLGQKALAKAPKARAAGQRAAAAGRERQAVRPSSSRGDVSTGRRATSEAEARRQRLEDMEI